MINNRHHIAVLLFAVALSAGSAASIKAAATPPIPSRSINLARYYPSRKAARAELNAVGKESAALPESTPSSDLYTYLQHADELVARTLKLSAYFTILLADDYDDQAAASAQNKAEAIKDRIELKARSALRALPAGTLEAISRRDPRLRRYAFLEQQVARQARHNLPPDAARVLDAIDGPITNTLWTVYQRANRIPIEGEPLSQASASPDRKVREAAWRGKWKARSIRADTNAAILLGTVKLGEEEARLRHYPDAVSAGYAHRDLDRKTVSRSLGAVQSNLVLYQAYDALLAKQLTARTGIADARPWDMALLERGSTSHFTFEDVRRIAPAALAPLGLDYVEHFSTMLTPSSGRVDIAATIGKRENGGFSIDAPGVPTGLYMADFKGSLDDLRVVIHEGGHAVAAQFANEGGTPSFFLHGPNWLMESYALLNEFLLFDYLARTSRSTTDRVAYTNRLVHDMMFQVFGSAEEATLEQAIYDAATAGKLQSASDLNAVTFGVMRRFEPWPDDILRTSSTLWSTKRLLFQDPFYYVNYLYAGIIAIDLYKEAKEHPDTFAAKYEALLRRGYDAPPMKLLAPLLGQGQTSDALESAAFSVIKAKMDELNILWREKGAS